MIYTNRIVHQFNGVNPTRRVAGMTGLPRDANDIRDMPFVRAYGFVTTSPVRRNDRAVRFQCRGFSNNAPRMLVSSSAVAGECRAVFQLCDAQRHVARPAKSEAVSFHIRSARRPAEPTVLGQRTGRASARPSSKEPCRYGRRSAANRLVRHVRCWRAY